MSFMQNMQCRVPDSFTELEGKKILETPRLPPAFNVPVANDEKNIPPEKVPYFMRVLHKNVMFNTGEILNPEVLGTRMKRKRENSGGENGDEPPASSSKKTT